MKFYFKNFETDILVTQGDDEKFRKIKICGFCEKDIRSNDVRDHCHLTGL